jgi:hypothetical protein
MERSKLSQYYYLACDRVHEAVDSLYESLHDVDGIPLCDPDSVIDSVIHTRRIISEELDLVKSIVKEYEEAND